MENKRSLVSRFFGKCVAIPIYIVLYIYMLIKSARKEVAKWNKRRRIKNASSVRR
jgi:hypothetical protein